MGKSIMTSIRPKCVKKIFNREKTMEIRKTKPNIELPCKVYIYCTQGKHKCYEIDKSGMFTLGNYTYDSRRVCNGKVVAEFTLNKVTTHLHNFIDCEEEECYNFLVEDVKNAGFNTEIDGLLDFDRFVEEYGKGKPLYGWHIDDLKIYDKPKELSEFVHWVIDGYGWKCKKNTGGNFEVLEELKRPPQSWCYVESLEETNED